MCSGGTCLCISGTTNCGAECRGPGQRLVELRHVRTRLRVVGTTVCLGRLYVRRRADRVFDSLCGSRFRSWELRHVRKGVRCGCSLCLGRLPMRGRTGHVRGGMRGPCLGRCKLRLVRARVLGRRYVYLGHVCMQRGPGHLRGRMRGRAEQRQQLRRLWNGVRGGDALHVRNLSVAANEKEWRARPMAALESGGEADAPERERSRGRDGAARRVGKPGKNGALDAHDRSGPGG